MKSLQTSNYVTRASPASDARHIPHDVTNIKGLPTHGRSRIKKQAQPRNLRLMSLNIGTLTGKSRELAANLKQRNVDIAVVQETKWKGYKAKEIGDGYKLYYHGTIKGRNGVGIILSEHLQQSITAIQRISDRIMLAALDIKTRRVVIISAYAPQQGCSDEEKDDFWQRLSDATQSVKEDEIVFVGGDLNGHVGSEHPSFQRNHGGLGIGTLNEDGARILDWAQAQDLALCNTFFAKRNSHLVTYSSGNHKTQIDFWACRRTDLKLVKNTKVIPFEPVASQHLPLVIDTLIPTPINRLPTTKHAHIKWWKHREFGDKLTPALHLAIQTTSLTEDVNECWESAVRNISNAAQPILGVTKPGRKFIDKQTWFWNEEVQQAVRDKKDAYKKWKLSQLSDDKERYRIQNRIAKTKVAESKNNYIADLYNNLESPEGECDIYRLARSRSNAAKDIIHFAQIKSKDGTILRDDKEIQDRWREHYNETCNIEFPHPDLPMGICTSGPVPEITTAEVAESVRKMKSGKATGPDGIPCEVWKLTGLAGIAFLTHLFNKIVLQHEVPKAWKSSFTIPIWKQKGDIASCSYYRPIRLLSHTMKIFEHVLDKRLRVLTNIAVNQCGFVKNVSTTDAIQAARILMEKHREKQQSLHMAFLDLEKAFDRVPHSLIWYSMRQHGVLEEYVDWIKLMYSDTTSIVRCATGDSQPYPITVGVHQGSSLSPLLFILCMDTITYKLYNDVPWTLLYADDVMLATQTRENLKQQVQNWSDRLSQYGLRLNIGKTAYLELGYQTPGSIEINGQPLEKCTTFKYLGSYLSSDGTINKDVKGRLNAAWLKWRSLSGILCDRRMPLKLKAKIYKTVVRPVALYATECWPSNSDAKRKLHTMEMNMLRWSYGVTRLDRIPNTNIRHFFGVTQINLKAREHRLRWFGHIHRADKTAVCRAEPIVQGVRPRGRPKKRWMDTIHEDLNTCDLAPALAQNREVWRRLIKAADPGLPGKGEE